MKNDIYVSLNNDSLDFALSINYLISRIYATILNERLNKNRDYGNKIYTEFMNNRISNSSPDLFEKLGYNDNEKRF